MNEINMEEYWENRAPDWINTHQTDDLDLMEHILDVLKIMKLRWAYNDKFNIEDVSDLGVGTGRWTKELSKIFPSYSGYDISQKLVDYTQKRFPNKFIQKMDIEQWPEDHHSKLLFSFTTLLHVRASAFERMIEKMSIPNAGGKFFFVEPVQGDCFDVDYVFKHDYGKYLDIEYYEEINGELAIIAGTFKKEKPDLSIVVATYNREEFVGKCLDSILDQNVDKSYEIIISDDCSDNKTKQVLLKKFLSSNNVRLFLRNENVGVGASRNFGNHQAKSEIIVVQDSDDYSYSNRLSEINDYFEKNDVDVFSSGYDLTNNALCTQEYVPYFDQTLEDMIECQRIGHPTLAYKKSAWEKYPYPNDRADVDYALLLNFKKNNLKFGGVDKPLVKYRRHDGQISVADYNLQQKLANEKRDEFKQ